MTIFLYWPSIIILWIIVTWVMFKFLCCYHELFSFYINLFLDKSTFQWNKCRLFWLDFTNFYKSMVNTRLNVRIYFSFGLCLHFWHIPFKYCYIFKQILSDQYKDVYENNATKFKIENWLHLLEAHSNLHITGEIKRFFEKNNVIIKKN